MRRPNLCNNSVTVADDSYKPQADSKEEDVRRLSLVRRVLGGVGGGGGGNAKKKECHQQQQRVFGVPLGELRVTSHSVPIVLHNICVFIQLHGLKAEGLWKAGCNSASVEDLKSRLQKDPAAEFDPRSADVRSVAFLLLLWLGELPQPILSHQVTSDLIAIMKKYPSEDGWFGQRLLALGSIAYGSVGCLLSLLYNYSSAHPSSLVYLSSVFSPLLVSSSCLSSPQASSACQDLLYRLISGYPAIFKHRYIKMEVEAEPEMVVMKIDRRTDADENGDRQTDANNSTTLQRKRKERQDSMSMDNERKFVRSNSEERPTTESSIEGDSFESMRRVSSHEDFSKARNKVEIQGSRKPGTQPLHERNSCSPTRGGGGGGPSTTGLHLGPRRMSQV